MLQLMREGCSYTYPPLSIVNNSFIQLSELEQASQESNPGSRSRESEALHLYPFQLHLCCLGSHLQKDISQLERAQQRAARFCCGDYTNRIPRYYANIGNWESLEARRKNNRLSLLHKNQHRSCRHHHRPIPPTELSQNSAKDCKK